MSAASVALPSVLGLLPDASGPSYWRILAPFTELKRLGYPCGFAPKDDALVGAVAPAFDGYVLARVAWPLADDHLAARWFAMLRSAGRFVVYDADDDLFSEACIPHYLESGLAAGLTPRLLEERRLAGIRALRRCDGVTVSTPYLAGVVRELTDRPVWVVPNAIDVPWFRRKLGPPRPSSGVTIGWVGGKRADADVAELAVAWGRIARDYPRARFVVAGAPPAALAASVPADRLELRPWLPLEAYPRLYAGLDIGCAPVADTPFNRSKSDIKAQEYAVAGACVVASPLLYADLVEHGENGYLAETADQWEAALADLVERPSLRSVMSHRLTRRVGRAWSLTENRHRWPAAWAAIASAARGRHDRLVRPA